MWVSYHKHTFRLLWQIQYIFMTFLSKGSDVIYSKIVRCLQNGRFQNYKITISQQAKCGHK